MGLKKTTYRELKAYLKSHYSDRYFTGKDLKLDRNIICPAPYVMLYTMEEENFLEGHYVPQDSLRKYRVLWG